MNANLFATGSCLCGAVTLAISSAPKKMLQCHCLDCQKSTGTGHSSMAYFDNDDVTINGKFVGYTQTADSGNEMSRYFCPVCGGRLFGRNSNQPELVSIPVGCLDDHSWFKPQVVLFASRRNNWDITSDDIPNFPHMPKND